MRDKITTAEPRLVLPFKDGAGRLLGVTCRALRGEELRYIMVRIDEDAPQIFGLDEANPLTTVYVVEGPIDSLFLPNAIAVGGTGFNKLDQLNVEKRRLTVVIDNQPRNREVVAIYRKVIDAGYNVFIWPDVQQKDINDLALLGHGSRELADLIDKRTYSGLKAMVEFNEWKKV
jgi:DNA primase